MDACAAVTISADVLNAVFALASEKPLPKPAAPAAPKPAAGLLSGLWSAFATRASTPLPQPEPEPEAPKMDPAARTERTVVLTLFAADLDVKVERALAAELVRATKKNPPARVKYELIYVRPFNWVGGGRG
jgi:hypothetical protein